VMCHTTFSVRK